jgi:hypothetical protein
MDIPRRSPRSTALKDRHAGISSMRTSETRAQLDESSENGQQGQFTFSSPGVARDGFQRGEGLLLVMACAALLVVSSQRAFDHGIGYGCRLDFVYFDDFTFELFVILKKSAHHR